MTNKNRMSEHELNVTVVEVVCSTAVLQNFTPCSLLYLLATYFVSGKIILKYVFKTGIEWINLARDMTSVTL